MFDAKINGIEFEASMKARWDELEEMRRKFIEARDSYHKLSRQKYTDVTKKLVTAHMIAEHADVKIGAVVNLHVNYHGTEVVCRHCNNRIFDIVYHKVGNLMVDGVQANDWEIILPEEATDV